MLSQDRVRIGDFIKVSEILGTIVSIDTRATILQGIDGTEIVIPNITMLSETVISYSTNPFRRIDLDVGVDYGTDLPMVTSLIKGILDKDSNIVPQPESVILVDEFGDSSINIKIRFWVESGNNWMNTRSNLAYKIKQAFDDLGINIPFPIRTLKLDENDRSILKTVNSIRQGEVPEPSQPPHPDVIKQVAAQTENLKTIPETLFETHVVGHQTITPPEQATPSQKGESIKNESPEEKPEAPETSAPTAPPTHL